MRILPDIARDLTRYPSWRRATETMLTWLIGAFQLHPASAAPAAAGAASPPVKAVTRCR